MGTIADMARRIAELKRDFPDVIVESIKDGERVIKDVIQDQLMSGLDSDTKPLRPTYLNDPYFKSKEQAQRYLAWKKSITPPTMSDILHLPPRDDDTPNLIIRGDYHDSITPEVAGGGEGAKLVIRSVGFYAGDDIEKKYGDKHLGLTDKGKAYLIDQRIRPAILSLLKRLRLK